MNNLLNKNILLALDSYKVSHHIQFPEGTEETFYYVESRGGKYDEVMVAGMNYLRELLSKQITHADVDEAVEYFSAHFGLNIFYEKAFRYVVDELDGKLPLEVRAVREGTVVPVKNAIAVVRTTDSRLFFLAGMLETLILRAIWYPTTVATESYKAKEIILKYLDKTSCANIDEVLPFRLHDFGARGVSSAESAAIGGLAHLYNFWGTDTVEALVLARNLFGEDMAGFSIPAREHSTTTSWGTEDGAFNNSIDHFGTGLYACVMDSYDYESALERITTGEMKDKIIEKGGTLVLRPDSGDPVHVVMQALDAVAKNVGFTVNDKGYKVLHPSYRVIQGDGIDVQMIQRILDYMEARGYSAENVAFGMGGGLLQHMDRDTQRFAMKCSAIKINGEWHGVSKNPKTDPSKRSKEGLLDLANIDGVYVTMSTLDGAALVEGFPYSVMTTYYSVDQEVVKDSLSEIRARSNNQVFGVVV